MKWGKKTEPLSGSTFFGGDEFSGQSAAGEAEIKTAECPENQPLRRRGAEENREVRSPGPRIITNPHEGGHRRDSAVRQDFFRFCGKNYGPPRRAKLRKTRNCQEPFSALSAALRLNRLLRLLRIGIGCDVRAQQDAGVRTANLLFCCTAPGALAVFHRA